MAPRATKYDFASSTLVSVRPTSVRTLFATASPIAESAAVSQRTINSADPRVPLELIRIKRPRPASHVQRHGHRTHAQIGRRGIERRHLDPNPARELHRIHPN